MREPAARIRGSGSDTGGDQDVRAVFPPLVPVSGGQKKAAGVWRDIRRREDRHAQGDHWMTM